VTGPSAGPDRGYLRLVLVGAVIGIPAALVAAVFLALVHELEGWLWDDLPDALGHSTPPWYLVVGLPVVGAVIVVLARRFLPGDGGAPPMHGLHDEPTPISHAPGVVLAALGTLGFGAVLGPELPVIALGSIVGMVGSRLARLQGKASAVASTAGSFSAISALFGGPVTAGILLTEAGLPTGAALLPALLPGFVAAGVGYLIFVGLGDWSGLNAPGITIPDLPNYQGTHVADLAVAVALGVVTALAVVLVNRLATGVAGLRRRLGMPGLLVAGGLAVGLCAQAGAWLVDDSQDVLFSGQASISVIVSEESVGVVLVLLVAKAIAYGVSLGCGFRGGPIFPAIFLSVALAAIAVVAFDMSPTWAVTVGAAAGMAARTKLVVSGLVFAGLLVGRAGADAMPAAVLAVAAAWLTTAAIDRGSTTSSAPGPTAVSPPGGSS
jgi:H+/Cl- antiporter ClcA